MLYVIHSVTHDILMSLPDDAPISSLNFQAFIRQANFPPDTPIKDLIYDPTLDTVRLKTDEEKLLQAKEAKLEELKASVQDDFSDIPDSLADAVKSIKLIFKFALLLKKLQLNNLSEEERQATENTLNTLEDHLTLLLQKFEIIYPDDYAIACVANYADRVVLGLSRYYAAKQAVLAAQTIEEVEAIQYVPVDT